MRTLVSRALVGVCLIAGLLNATPNGGATVPYERIICVVPIVGSGTLDDPRKPLLAPVAGAVPASTKKTKGFLDSAAIISYHSVPTDDGLFAIIEFVARDRAAFQPITGNTLGLTILDPRTTPLISISPLSWQAPYEKTSNSPPRPFACLGFSELYVLHNR